MTDTGDGTWDPLDPEIAAKVRASFAAQGLMQTLGARIARLGRGRVTIAAPIGPGVSQQKGFAHAGLSFAIGDSAAGYAALSVMETCAEVLTTEMKIHLLAPARGETLEAQGRVIRAGRRLVVVTADIHALEGDERRHVATLLGSMMPIED